MKKVFLLILLTAVALSCCMGLAACGPIKQPEIPTDADFESKSTAPDGRSVEQCTPEENLFMATYVMKSLGFKSVNNGSSKAVGITQRVYSERTVLNDAVASKTTSLGFVKLGKQFYYENGSYVVRDASKVRDTNDVDWESGAKRLSKDRFQSLYGLPPIWLTAFVTNDDSVKEARLVEEKDGIYTFEYKLDNVVSVYYLKYQMRTYSGSKGFPVFDETDGIIMTVKMDKDRKVSSISTLCSYKVDMLGGVKCEEKLEEVFYDIGKVASIPERAYFATYLTASITDSPEAETVSGVLLDTFMPLIKNNSLYADVKLSGLANLDAKVKAVIDTQNLENLTLDLVAPDIDLLFSYKAGRLTLNLGELKAYLDFGELGGLGGGESLLDNATLVKNGSRYTVLLPFGPLNAEINAVKTKDGDFEFADAVLGPLVIGVTETKEFQVPEADTENCLNLLPLVRQFTATGNSVNLRADIADLLSANLSLPTDGGDILAAVSAGDADIYAKINGKQIALRYDDLKMKFAYKDLLNTLFNRFYELEYVRELLSLTGGLTDSLQLGWNGVSRQENLYIASFNAGALVCNATLEAGNEVISLRSISLPVGEKEILISLSDEFDYSPVSDTESYPDGTGLLELINERFEIDLAAKLDDYDARLLFDLKTLQAKLVARPIADSSLKLSVMPDRVGETALFLSCGDFNVMFGQNDLARQGYLLKQLANRYSPCLSELLESFLSDGESIKISAGTQVAEDGISLVLCAAEMEIRLNFSDEGGKLTFVDAQGLFGGAAVRLSPFEGDADEFSFIEDTEAFADGAPLLPLDESFMINAAINAGGTTAYLSVNLWDGEIKAVVPDLYENAVYVGIEAKTGTLKFKYGGLQLKTDADGVQKLVEFVVPLIGDENLGILLEALGSVELDLKTIADSLRITGFDENGTKVTAFEINIGTALLEARVLETDGKYYPDCVVLSVGKTQIKVSPCAQPDFSELDAATVFPEVTDLLDMFTDYKLAFQANINDVQAKIGLDILNGEVYAECSGVSALYFSDVRETTAGPEKYGKALVKIGALEAQADVVRLLQLYPKISQKLGIEFPKAQITFDPADIADGFSTTEKAVALNFSLLVDGKPLNISAVFDITENGFAFGSASAEYESITVTLTLCDFGGFYPFDREGEYLDLNALADDYIDVALDLATARGWQLEASGSVTTQKPAAGETQPDESQESQSISVQTAFAVSLSFALTENNDLTALLLSLSLTDAVSGEQTTFEAYYSRESRDTAPQGTVFVNYNGLKARIAVDSVKQLASLAARATELVPALGDMLNQTLEKLSGTGDALREINLVQALQSISYKNGTLNVEIAENSLLKGLGEFSLALSREGDGLKLNASGISLTGIGGYDSITADADITARSRASDGIVEELIQSVGASDQYVSFDSLPDLLNVLLNTVETRHIYASGIAKVQITLLSKDVPVSITADIHENGRITAVVKLEISGKLIGVFNNVSLLGGSHVAYMYLDTASDFILLKRIDTINKAFSGAEKKTSYLKIASDELADKGLDILYFMTDLSDSICGTISDAVANAPDNPFRIEEVFKNYGYADNRFFLEMDLTSFNPTLGTVALNITHDENMILKTLNAQMALNLTESISGTVSITDLTFETSSDDLASADIVEAEQNSGNY